MAIHCLIPFNVVLKLTSINSIMLTVNDTLSRFRANAAYIGAIVNNDVRESRI